MDSRRHELSRLSIGTLLLGFVLLGGIVAGTTWLVHAEQHSRQIISHAHDVQADLYRLLSLLQDAETGQRGYLLTGDPTYLEPYQRATAMIEKEFDAFGVPRDPGLYAALSHLRLLAHDKLTELRTTIDDARAGRHDEAMAIVRSGAGKSFMDQARGTIRQLLDEQNRRLAASAAAAGRTAQWLQASVIAAAALLLLLGYFTVRMAHRQLQQARESSTQLREVHDRLVQEMVQREQLEEQYRQSQKMEAIGQLTGGIAHDFNNMLSVIIGSLSLLQRRQERGERDLGRFINTALDGASRAATLTQRLLAFSRQQPLRPEPIDVNKFVAGMCDLLRRSLGSDVQLETVLAGGLWKTHADASQLENALLNLAVNARDAMPGGGRLTIETANCHLDDDYAARHVEVPAGQYVLLAVTDTGTGMTPEVMVKAFDPFFTTKGVGVGSGLGLSQVYGFVKQSHGHVKIYSEPGHGTTFKVYLPRFIGAEDDTLSRPPSRQLPPSGKAGEIVLVVEDDEEVRRLTVESLRELNYTVLEANGAAAALRVLDSEPNVTLLFTDIIMPEVNGRRLAEEALRRRPELKVLYTTGYTRNAIVHNGVLDPGVHLLSKPFTLEHLAVKLRDVLESG